MDIVFYVMGRNAGASQSQASTSSQTTITSVVLYADSWDSISKTQTAKIVDTTEDSVITVAPQIVSKTASEDAAITCINVGANLLTFACDEIPETNITVDVKIENNITCKYWIEYYNAITSSPILNLTPNEYIKGNAYALPTFESTGYDFLGWATDSSNMTGTAISGITSETIGNLKLYARLNPKVYTITYNLNGGEISGSEVNHYSYGIGAGVSTALKTGHRFLGWYDNPEFTGNAVTNISATDYGDKVLYAKYTDQFNVNISTQNATVTITDEAGNTYSNGDTITYGILAKNQRKAQPGFISVLCLSQKGMVIKMKDIDLLQPLNHVGTNEIKTDRLILRRFRLSDNKAMFKLSSNPEVVRYLPWQPHKSIAETDRVLKDWVNAYESKNTYNWAIEIKDVVIGNICVVEHNDECFSCHIAWQIDVPYWNRGIMTEAAQAVVDYLFDTVGYYRITSGHDTRNIGSGRVMQKIGMTLEGTFRKYCFQNDGSIGDRDCYAILKSDRDAH